jgi:hypothetical protein
VAQAVIILNYSLEILGSRPGWKSGEPIWDIPCFSFAFTGDSGSVPWSSPNCFRPPGTLNMMAFHTVTLQNLCTWYIVLKNPTVYVHALSLKLGRLLRCTKVDWDHLAETALQALNK